MSVPSRWVRARLGLWTILSTLRHRRLRRLHSMANQQFHHDMVWAFLFGKFEWESLEKSVSSANFTDKALPYVKQLAPGLQAAGCFQGFQAGWTAQFSKVDVEQFETVLMRDREKAKTRVVSAPEGRVVPNDQLGIYRCECGQGFMSIKKALQLHPVKKHQKVDMRTIHIVANQCSRCTLPPSSIPITQKHWLANMCGHPSTQKGPSSVNISEYSGSQDCANETQVSHWAWH